MANPQDEGVIESDEATVDTDGPTGDELDLEALSAFDEETGENPDEEILKREGDKDPKAEADEEEEPADEEKEEEEEEEADGEKDTSEEEGDEKTGDKETGEEDEESEEKDESEEKSIEDRLKERFADDSEKESDSKETPDDKQEPDEKPDEKPAAKEPDQVILGKDLAAEALSLIDLNNLPTITLDDGTVVDLKDQYNSFPDDFRTMMTLAAFIAKSAVGGITPGDNKEIEEKIAELRQNQDNMAFDLVVARKHNEYFAYQDENTKEHKEFWGWYDKQDKQIQSLGDSSDPDDAILLIDKYKKDLADAATKEHDDKQKEKAKKTRDRHKSTMRRNAALDSSKGGGDDDVDEAQAGFDAEAK